MTKEIKKLFFLILLGLATVVDLKAQDPEFTQFYANPLYLNPAFVGATPGPRFCLNYRNQWPSLSASYVTYAASYDQHFDAIGGGIGAQVWRDQAGDGRLSTTYASLAYGYQLTLGSNPKDYFIIKAALQASAFQRSIDFSKLIFGDEIDARRGIRQGTTQEKLPSRGVESTAFIPDFNFGAVAFTKKYFGGFAVHHIIEPPQSFFGNPSSTLPRKLTMHAGMMIPIDNWKREPTTFISPNILFQRQAKFTQVNFGAYLIKNYFVVGMWYRQTRPNSDAVMALIGVKKDRIKIGYSYDLTVSDARAAASGSHEVSLIVELDSYNPRQVKKWKKLNCPDL
ncbi:MAG: type IX secretion system membrane protein PorP/SprF [Bacteroidetes bacterium]|nr:type IX secretion system membrane protein PorP/SprF [Bacteroidota bacterium]